MLAQHLQGLVERIMLHAFGHPVTTCCDMLRVQNRTSAHALALHCCTNLVKRLQHHATSTNVAWKIWTFSNLSQQHPTCRNTWQQDGQTHATCCTQQLMLRYVGLQCLDRLAGDISATDHNNVERKLLHPFGHPVATCCDMCCPGATLLHETGQMITISCSIHKCWMRNLTIFKVEPTTPNMSQHVAKGWPNARNMLHPTMLRYLWLKCCSRLPGAWDRCVTNWAENSTS